MGHGGVGLALCSALYLMLAEISHSPDEFLKGETNKPQIFPSLCLLPYRGLLSLCIFMWPICQ